MHLESKLPIVEPPPVKPAWDTLEALAEWLETKNPDETYCWWGYGHCLFKQYGMWLELDEWPSAAYNKALAGFDRRYPELGSNHEPFGIASRKPHTFGAALLRTRAEIARLCSSSR